MALVTSVAICASLLAVSDQAQPHQADAQRIALAVEARHRSLIDFEARFVQAYRSGALGREIVESGLLRYRRPGRMRWEYRTPERKLFLCDGRDFYFYVPADRQVTVRRRDASQGLAYRLLSGQVDIVGEFAVAIEQADASGTRLRLTPRRPDAEVESVTLEVDDGLRLLGLTIRDRQRNTSHFRFEKLRENRGLSERDFRFEIPAGVEVVRE